MTETNSGTLASARPRSADAKTLFFLLAAVGMSLLLYCHAAGLNGPAYWQWIYRRLPGMVLYPLMATAMVPFFLAQWFWLRRRRVALPLVLMMVTTIALQMALESQDGSHPGLDRIHVVIESRFTTGYYTDAAALLAGKVGGLRALLADYPHKILKFNLHPSFRPPGLMIFCIAWIKLLGVNHASATAVGLSFGVLGAAAVPGVYMLMRTLGGTPELAFSAAAYLAICPSLICLYPMADEINPLLACCLLGSWIGALRTGRAIFAVACGVTFFISTLIGYHLLVLGFFMVVYPFLRLEVPIFGHRKHRLQGIGAVAAHALIAWAVIVGLYAILWAATGFEPISMFSLAHRRHHELDLALGFVNHWTWLFDLTDFALGAGWLAMGLVVLALVRSFRIRGQDPRAWRLTLLIIVQIVALAASAAMVGETARVWMFLLPLLMFPVGVELSTWDPVGRQSLYLGLWLITATIGRNLRFILL